MGRREVYRGAMYRLSPFPDPRQRAGAQQAARMRFGVHYGLLSLALGPALLAGASVLGLGSLATAGVVMLLLAAFSLAVEAAARPAWARARWFLPPRGLARLPAITLSPRLLPVPAAAA